MAIQLEDRVDTLEAIFGRFMAHTDMAIGRLDRTVERIERSIEEMKTQGEKDRARMERSMEEMKTQAELDRRESRRRSEALSQKLGTLVEDIVAPSMRRIASEDLGFAEIERFMPNVEQKHSVTRLAREFDVIVVGTDAVLLNETKSNAKSEYAKEFAEFLESGEFYQYFPEFKNKKLVPVFSSLKISENVLAYLTKQRIYAVAMGEEMMQVLNLKEVGAMK